MNEWNKVRLSGKVVEIEKIQELCEFPFYGYMAKLEISRLSNTRDEVVVVFDIGAVNYLAPNGKILNMFPVGSNMYVEGAIQTLKNFTTGKLLVYTKGHYVSRGNDVNIDSVDVCGRLASSPKLRITPKGSSVADLTLEVSNELTGGKSYIPCICWNVFAEKSTSWKEGDKILMKARVQSRSYQKVVDIETCARETRTAYEVSIWKAMKLREKEEEVKEKQKPHVRTWKEAMR